MFNKTLKIIFIASFSFTLLSCGGDNQPRVRRIAACGDAPKNVDTYKASNFSAPVTLPNSKSNNSLEIKPGYYNIDGVDAHIESKNLSSKNTGRLKNFQMYYIFRRGFQSQEQKENNEVEFNGRMECNDSYSRSFAGKAIESFNFSSTLEIINGACSKGRNCAQDIKLADIHSVEAGFYEDFYFRSFVEKDSDKSSLDNFLALNEKGLKISTLRVHQEITGDRIQMVHQFDTDESIITVSAVYSRCLPPSESAAFTAIKKAGVSEERLKELNEELKVITKTYENCKAQKNTFTGLNADK